jgi:hypothetical protein
MSGAAPPPAQGAPAGSEAESSGSARDLLLAAASAVMREGDLVDISLSELSLRSGLNSALVKYYWQQGRPAHRAARSRHGRDRPLGRCAGGQG